MTAIPQTFSLADISDWWKLHQELGVLKSREALARKVVFENCFKEGTYKPEGTNKFELPDHYELKAVTSLNRTIQIETARALAPELAKLGVMVDDLIRWKPEVSITDYRQLTDEQRKLFDQCLEIKPGSPQLKIELPAKYKNSTGGQPGQPPKVAEEVKTPF
jgi:hypothetical protein